MLNLEAPAEVRIFIANRIEGVRVSGDNALERSLAERGDVGAREHLVQPFFANPTHVVARIRLRVVQNSEVDAGFAQQCRERLADALVARVE